MAEDFDFINDDDFEWTSDEDFEFHEIPGFVNFNARSMVWNFNALNAGDNYV